MRTWVQSQQVQSCRLTNSLTGREQQAGADSIPMMLTGLFDKLSVPVRVRYLFEMAELCLGALLIKMEDG